jgi:hypothetical protein
MSKEEAEDLVRRFLEHKMMWHSADGFVNSYAVHQAINILGPDKVEQITKEFHKIWNEE